MSLFEWEFRKIFKRRSSLAALLVALAFSVFFGIYQGTVSLTYRASMEVPREYGPALAKKEQAMADPWRGPLTADKLKTARDQFAQAFTEENMSQDGETPITEVWERYARPVSQIFSNVQSVLGTPANTYQEYVNDILSFTDEDLEGFYAARNARVERNLREELDREADVQYFLALNEKVETPFYYDWTRGQEYYADTLGFLLTVVGWLLCIAAAPLFSGEYQSGAAAVILCTRNGRSKVAAAKILASLMVTVLWWALCGGAFVGLQILLMGTRGLNCPVQASFFTSSFLPLTIWQTELYALLLGLLSCLAAVAVTAAFSAKMGGMFQTIVCSLAVVLFAPMIGSFIKLEPVQKITVLLPLATDYACLFDTQVYHLFDKVLWLPLVLLAVLPLYMLVLAPLAGWIYTKHQVR